MKCKICGGNLEYFNGKYFCKSCENYFTISDYYEDFDAYICYIENDKNGRRTKDSIIAQDLYQKLEANKIKSFYSRISASDLTGDLYEKVCNAALVTAKTVIIIGTSKENFESLVDHYESLYNGKIVIPVFFEMNPYDIPKSISAIQALDYSKIGYDVDLAKSILNAIDREDEANKIDEYKKPSGKNKKTIIVTCCLVTVLIGIIVYIVFGTKLIMNRDLDQNTIDQRVSQYNTAISCIEEGKFSKAIELLSELNGYRDSDSQLQLLYEKYAGYYQNENQNITFHLQILTNNTAKIEMSFFQNNKVLKIDEEISFHNKNQASKQLSL